MEVGFSSVSKVLPVLIMNILSIKDSSAEKCLNRILRKKHGRLM